jgi:cysteine synthase
MRYSDPMLDLIGNTPLVKLKNLSDNGILVGITSGAVACVLKKMGERPEYNGKILVGILADSAERYLSVEGLFNS